MLELLSTIQMHMYMQEYLLDGLRDIIKYLRNAKPRDKAADTESEGPPKKHYKGKYPSVKYINVTDIQATGEDKSWHDRHIKLLQLEERKVTPDMNIMADLIKGTFVIRIAGIFEEPQPVFSF